jgi:hypothetical protein
MTSSSPQTELSFSPSSNSQFPSIDGKLLKQLVGAGLTWLNTNQQIVNSLNVFPVPDGDTGTNMSLTMQAGFAEISKNDSPNAGQVAHSVAHGALMGARGNSGVILSQIWRGIARSLDSKTEIDPAAFSQALQEARETAYKGVVRPVEGTILTVATDIAVAAEHAHREGCQFPEFLHRVVDAADRSVQRTPELLPVLREAGVVDAGGKGLFVLLEGMTRFLDGKPLDKPLLDVTPLSALKWSSISRPPLRSTFTSSTSAWNRWVPRSRSARATIFTACISMSPPTNATSRSTTSLNWAP